MDVACGLRLQPKNLSPQCLEQFMSNWLGRCRVLAGDKLAVDRDLRLSIRVGEQCPFMTIVGVTYSPWVCCLHILAAKRYNPIFEEERDSLQDADCAE